MATKNFIFIYANNSNIDNDNKLLEFLLEEWMNKQLKSNSDLNLVIDSNGFSLETIDSNLNQENKEDITNFEKSKMKKMAFDLGKYLGTGVAIGGSAALTLIAMCKILNNK